MFILISVFYLAYRYNHLYLGKIIKTNRLLKEKITSNKKDGVIIVNHNIFHDDCPVYEYFLLPKEAVTLDKKIWKRVP